MHACIISTGPSMLLCSFFAMAPISHQDPPVSSWNVWRSLPLGASVPPSLSLSHSLSAFPSPRSRAGAVCDIPSECVHACGVHSPVTPLGARLRACVRLRRRRCCSQITTGVCMPQYVSMACGSHARRMYIQYGYGKCRARGGRPKAKQSLRWAQVFLRRVVVP
jgi:hypothetical protein